MRELSVRNRQRLRRVHLPLLRRIARTLLQDRHPETPFEIGVYLVAAPEMTRINQTFLNHAGSTDVITFDYSVPAPTPCLAGEIFICVDDAVRQAREFGTTWPAEVVRYLVHGLLHLEGYDDLITARRRAMKREEHRVLEDLAERFPLRGLARPPKVKP